VFKWCVTMESGQTYKLALEFLRSPSFSESEHVPGIFESSTRGFWPSGGGGGK
jgi:hypothetical protein